MLTLKSWTGLFHRGAGTVAADIYHTVKVRAPRDYFSRADAFLEDIVYTSQEELEGINKTFLVNLLFDNFMDHVRKGKDLYSYILQLRSKFGGIVASSNSNDRPSGGNVPGFQWGLSFQVGNTDRTGHLTLNVRLHPAEVNRMRVFFDDMNWKHHHPLNMEMNELLSLLFIEFITELRNGLSEETKEEIIAAIVHKWGDQ
ncbi:hypothetical protein A8709_16485 [Paenibacillus pectinilyticus]|uniref:Uncharacterized protein n=1 Tax=Paenibacillus pectinilyticus TaxID=512399 RepID=A0A1C1A527_9BACL|nr:hypothetical protein [Paenibacillus pectinilyticus]OCT15657.1 hypothetical protein A8709_16485 [Paenibacillus pectinilyticus]